MFHVYGNLPTVDVRNRADGELYGETELICSLWKVWNGVR
jgi:hypothetical protein